MAADYKEQNFESSTAALSFLRSDLRLQGQKYDVIMCSKFVNEFYNCRDDYQNNKGFYQRLIEISGEYLSEDGFLIISDITTPCFEGCDKWLPELMSSEINRALREPGCELSIIQPLSCAFFQAKCAEPQKCFIQSTFKVRHRCLPPAYSLDWSKICIKVLCKKTFAHRILSREEVQQSFIIARKQDNKINTCSDWGDRALCCSNNTSAVSRNFRDAFGWSNSQT